jgi:hypothetical protein
LARSNLVAEEKITSGRSEHGTPPVTIVSVRAAAPELAPSPVTIVSVRAAAPELAPSPVPR